MNKGMKIKLEKLTVRRNKRFEIESQTFSPDCDKFQLSLTSLSL